MLVATKSRTCHGMLIKSWAILGSKRLIVYSKHNINVKGCNCKFKNSFFGVWCITTCRHPSTHIHFIYHYCPSHGLVISVTNRYVFIMIEHFSKWLKLVPLLGHNSERTTYAFINRVFSMFGAPTKLLIDRSVEFH
jgi:hypothetical protein